MSWNIGAYTHIATLIEFLVTKTKGFAVSYLTREPDEPDVLEDEIDKLRIRGVRVKALMAVPKFWIFLLKELLEELKGKPVLRDLGEKILAIEKNGHLQNLGMIDKAKLTAIRLLLRDKLGGHFSYGISSSSKLDPALVEIFGKLGITVLDIYGATECTGIIARSRLNEIHPGTSGRILPRLEWRLARPRSLPGWTQPVGLLEVRGPTVATGYLGVGGVTEPLALTPDGWLATGDLACVDEQARVRLVGREKELIPWICRWLLDPQHLSNLVTRSIAVKDAMVVHAHPADSRLSIYVFPDWPRIRLDVQWRRDVAAGLTEDQALKPLLVEAIRYAASLLAIPAELDTSRIWSCRENWNGLPRTRSSTCWNAPVSTRRELYDDRDPKLPADPQSPLSAADGCRLVDPVPACLRRVDWRSRGSSHCDRQLGWRLVPGKPSDLAEYESNNTAFGNREWSILLLDTKSVADPAFLRDLAQLTSDLEAVPHIRRVLSLGNVRALSPIPGGAPTLAPLLDSTAADPAAVLRVGLARFPSMERLLLPQGWVTQTAVLVQSDNFLHDLKPYRLELVDAVHRLVSARSSVRSHAFAGTTVINAELNRSARRDALRFYVLVTAMVLLFGWLALRDVRDLSIVLAVLTVAVLVPMGGIALFGIPFNMVTILLPLILVSLSVCDVIHVVNAFHGQRRERSAEDAARAAVSALWTPCFCGPLS